MNDTLFTRKTLAAYLVCTPRTIDNLRAKGLPHLMVGDSPRFELQDVLGWLAANPRRAAAEVTTEDVELVAEVADTLRSRADDAAAVEALGQAIRSYPDPHRV